MFVSLAAPPFKSYAKTAKRHRVPLNGTMYYSSSSQQAVEGQIGRQTTACSQTAPGTHSSSCFLLVSPPSHCANTVT